MHYDIETGVREKRGLFSKAAIIILIALIVVALAYLVITGEISAIMPW